MEIQLNISVKELMLNLAERLKKMNYALDMEPDTLEELKAVLSTIANIREISMDVEFELDDIHERYRTLKMYNAEITKEEEALLGSIRFF